MWENLSKVLQDYIVEVRNIYQDKLISEDKIATGDLLNSCEYLIESDDRQIEVSLRLAEYWKFVEFGRKPGKFPPVDKIREWIRVKPVIPHEIGGRLPTEQQLSYLIGRKIADEGIDPTNALSSSVKEINSRFETLIEDAITKDVSSMVDIIFSEYFAE